MASFCFPFNPLNSILHSFINTGRHTITGRMEFNLLSKMGHLGKGGGLFRSEEGYKLIEFQANPEIWSSVKWAMSGLICTLTFLPVGCQEIGRRGENDARQYTVLSFMVSLLHAHNFVNSSFIKLSSDDPHFSVLIVYYRTLTNTNSHSNCIYLLEFPIEVIHERA